MEFYSEETNIQVVPVFQKKQIITQLAKLFVFIDIVIRCVARIEQVNATPLTWLDVFYVVIYIGLLLSSSYVFIRPLVSNSYNSLPIIKRIVHNFFNPLWDDELMYTTISDIASTQRYHSNQLQHINAIYERMNTIEKRMNDIQYT